MSGKISDPVFYKINIRGSKSPWWETLPVPLRAMLLRKVASMLSSVSDLQHFLHQQMILNPEFGRSKPYSHARQMADRLSLYLARGVRAFVVRLPEATATKGRKKARSARSRTKTSRKATRT